MYTRPLMSGSFWLGQVGVVCPPGQFSPGPGQPCRGSVGTMPGGAPGVPSQTPTSTPTTTPTPSSSPTPTPGANSSPSSGQPGAAPQQQLIACINGPDLYDIYNPNMSVVAKGVLNPNTSYPNAQIQFPKGPPCPVPQATGVGGLCDVPAAYLAPKDPSRPPGRGVLACYVPNHGVTLLDYATGAPIGTHLNAACLSLLSDVTIARDDDPRCGGVVAAAAPPPPPPPSVTPPTTTPPSGTPPAAAPPTSAQPPTAPVTGPMPVQPIAPPAPIGPPPGGQFQTQPIMAPPFMPNYRSMPTYGGAPSAPLPTYAPAAPPAAAPIPTTPIPATSAPSGAVPIADWFQQQHKGCPVHLNS